MITNSTGDYSIEQLKHLSAALYAVEQNIIYSGGCDTQDRCTPSCKIYAFCTYIHNTRVYLNKKIREREALEIHRDTQESK